jgi:hypothetical protein
MACENEVRCDVTMGSPFELRDASDSRFHEVLIG